ncbi:olfactory receptor 4P4-like [Notamacropus eugenii]|uniref:olfactory receptor 4P4-like n=1 Tax=Notamacropus eugenii TaxID=9315 RepID=UPI003B66B30C
MKNRNNITEFILLGLSQNHDVQNLCFILFSFCYVVLLMGNLIIMISILVSQLIDQPTYYFLTHLSLIAVCYTSTVTPKLISDLLIERKSISYNHCLIQVFTMHLFRAIEIFVLTGMAYDRYVAICKPLQYQVIMSRERCNMMVLSAFAWATLHSFSQIVLMILLPFCGPNEINHSFCDVYPLLELACIDTQRVGFLVIVSSGMVVLMVFIVVMGSYTMILYTFHGHSFESHRKALSTCGSHITVVILFFGPVLFIYIRPATTFWEDKVFALFYTITAPMLNPFIYTLKNKDMKNAVMNTWSRKKFLRRKLVF